MSFSDFVKKYHPIVHPERISKFSGKKKRSKSYSGYSRGDKVRFSFSTSYFWSGTIESRPIVLTGWILRVYRNSIYISTQGPDALLYDYQVYPNEILEVLE